MRDSDSIKIAHEQEVICLYVHEGPVPGCHSNVRHAGVRLSIEEALGMLDDLKKQIKNALEKR
jgi:hypothetical protein